MPDILAATPDSIVNTALHGMEIAALIWVGIFRLGGMAEAVKQNAYSITKLESAIEILGALRISDAADRERANADRQVVMLQGQRFDEMMKQHGDRMNHISERNDTMANVLNGRLEAINNIVAGHTAKLERLSDQPRHGRPT
jgi:hypothetical protein